MPIISDFFYITGVDDRELITYNPDTISLDANNIQTTPVLFTIISGAEVYFSVRIETALGEDVTIWEEINVPTPYNSYSFVHPADKYGLSNQVTVIAYSDSERKNKLGQRTVSIIRAEAEPNPRPEKEWNASMIFNNGDMILLGDVIYMWSNPVPGNSKIPPKDDIQQNPLTTSWKAYPEMIVMGTRFLLAHKITADQIDVDSIFAGTIQANDATINNFNATNVRIQSGYIGGFRIEEDGLYNENLTSRISISDASANFFRVNAPGDTMCAIRKDRGIALDVSGYGENTIALEVLAQAGNNTFAIKSHGNVFLKSRDTEHITINGLRVNYRWVETAEVILQTSDDYIFAGANARDIYMPRNAKAGKIIYFKAAGFRGQLRGFFRNPDNAGTHWDYGIKSDVSRIFIYDGEAWTEFFCG